MVNFVDKKILDEQNIQMIGDDLFRLVDELGRRKMLLNFSNVEFMSSAALGKLIRLHQRLQLVGGKLVLCGISKEHPGGVRDHQAGQDAHHRQGRAGRAEVVLTAEGAVARGPASPARGRQAMTDHRIAAERVIPSDLGEARRVQDEIEEALQAARYGDRDIFAIKLALEEALVNAIKHGNQMDPAKRVRVAYTVTPERFDIRITDEGPGFNPDDVPDPTAPENLERRCGRGLLLIRNYMTEVNYHGRGNVVTMSKLRNGTPE